MAKRWRIATFDPARIAALESAAGIPTVVAQLLLCRGIDHPESAKLFLEAKLTGLRDPEELPGAVQAAELLHQAIRDGRRITVYGDYDCDGMTATAILLLGLRLLGARADYYIPNRIDEGYGLNCDAIRALAAAKADVVVTVDCGITSVTEAALAAELDLTLILTDHHQALRRDGVDCLPNAAVIVHPGLADRPYAFPGLCGAAVALKVAWALCQRASEAKRVTEAMRTYLMRAVGLAAIGTIADVVPLVDENRILARHGLNCLRHFKTPGIVALEQVTNLCEKPELSCEDIAFTIAPRLNAAGRLGQAELGVELLTTESPECAEQLAKFIHGLNEQRQTLEKSVYRAANKAAQEQGDPHQMPAIVLAGRGWHAGVIGIVAGRLAEHYHRPVVLISLDELVCKPGMGSGRSVPGFDLHEAFSACDRHLLGHGGHAAAAGLTIDERSIDAFRTDFCAEAERRISIEDRIAELFVDAEAPFTALTHQTVRHIESLAPFGHGNLRPVLCTTNVRLAEPPKRIGANGHHLSLRLEQHGVSLRAVAFGGGDWADEIAAAQGPLSVAFKPIINHWKGRQTVEMQISDWRCDG